MKNIIDKIFNDNDFIKLYISDKYNNQISYYANYSKKAANFYLVVYLSEIESNFLSEQVPDYYDAVKEMESGYDERMDKNLSMLICINSDRFDNNTLSDVVFELEEDPYFFKKYVFEYNRVQLEQLEILFNNIKDSNSTLNSIVNNAKYFLDFKSSNKNTETLLYEICTRLMIKLPFLGLNKQQEDIEDLSQEINKVLNDEQLLELNSNLMDVDVNDVDLIEQLIEIWEGGKNE
ncbi:hypothetical protein CHH58_15830 [Terribacillus saccharophilus]|uniref:ABC-three component system middle component 1 n=1 Tax=Terribacillus saccharophilus TaxID=361277 RepID=UPI000BA64408|nr:ABC-three component system middle component 1 [Terribacillus saccharophilus]PAF35684.1 hypothetical protein CHH58_15830 [Terribacillus saccharophilus]